MYNRANTSQKNLLTFECRIMHKLVLDGVIDAAIKSLVNDIADSCCIKYGSYFGSAEVEAIEHEDREGFFAYTNGGYACTIAFALDSVASGKAFHPAIQACYDRIMLDCMRDFVSNNKLELDNGKPVLDYTDIECWSIIDIDDETKEDYFNFEQGYCDSVYYITVRAMYYDTNNRQLEGGGVLFDLAYNLDDYGRDNKAVNVFSTVLGLNELTLENIAGVEKKMQSFV